MPNDKRHHPGRRAGDRTRLTRLRDFLNRPGPWIVLAFVILFIVLILGVVVYSREQADRSARRASEQANYQQCLASIPQITKIVRFVRGVRTVGYVLLLNSERMHNATRPSDGSLKLYRIQAANIRRLRHALRDQSGVSFTVPTPEQCREALRRG